MINNNPDACSYLPLRAKKRAATEGEAWAVLESPDVAYGFLGTHGVSEEGNMPYVVPMNFAADPTARAIYLHTTIDNDSKRNRALVQNPQATFVVVAPDAEVVSDGSGIACKYSMMFTSVMAFGTVEKIEQPAEKARILNFLMKQKVAQEVSQVTEAHSAITTIYTLKVSHVSGSKK